MSVQQRVQQASTCIRGTQKRLERVLYKVNNNPNYQKGPRARAGRSAQRHDLPGWILDSSPSQARARRPAHGVESASNVECLPLLL